MRRVFESDRRSAAVADYYDARVAFTLCDFLGQSNRIFEASRRVGFLHFGYRCSERGAVGSERTTHNDSAGAIDDCSAVSAVETSNHFAGELFSPVEP